MKTIAFIPVRGGSKSIPLKNIKPLCGKPLVCWNIEALEACPHVDTIVVATDSDDIWRTVEERHYHKVQLYRRSAENACDTASTESVMLEYIHAADLDPETCFMLVQATSPLTQTQHFEEALQRYATGQFDSLLSCVRSYRFFWNADGTSMNYDYRQRPRRQDFDGLLMENGAFYIYTVRGILDSENRLGGRIGFYEMPDYTATEIDEPDDWAVIEHLMRRHGLAAKSNRAVRLFLTDVDGTLTDGGMYYSERGDELKKFNTRDGMGLQRLREAGIQTGILTSERTDLVERRAAKLQVNHLVQAVRGTGKLEAAQALCRQLGIGLDEVAYIGDDLNCIDLLSQVGHAACPAGACQQVRTLPGIHVMQSRGGEGCVREWADLLLLQPS